MKYDTPEDALAKIRNNFTYHPPKGDQVDRYKEIRDTALNYVINLCARCPHSRERSLALTKIEESVMWAHAAIARNEKGRTLETDN